MKRQTGHSLIEMIMVIAVLSVIMSLSAVVAHGLLGINRASSKAYDQQASFARLAETFCADVHAAEEMHPVMAGDNTPAQRCVLRIDDAHTIVYEHENGELVRIKKDRAQMTRRSFPLPTGATVAFKTNRYGETTLVTLIVTPGKTANGASGRSVDGLRTCAQLARDRQYSEIYIELPEVTIEATSEATNEPEEETTDE